MQEDLVSITFSELISEEKILENNSDNISILQNDLCCTPKYVKILMNSGASILIIHNLFLCTNKFGIRKIPLVISPQWLGHF